MLQHIEKKDLGPGYGILKGCYIRLRDRIPMLWKWNPNINHCPAEFLNAHVMLENRQLLQFKLVWNMLVQINFRVSSFSPLTLQVSPDDECLFCLLNISSLTFWSFAFEDLEKTSQFQVDVKCSVRLHLSFFTWGSNVCELCSCKWNCSEHGVPSPCRRAHLAVSKVSTSSSTSNGDYCDYSLSQAVSIATDGN